MPALRLFRRRVAMLVAFGRSGRRVGVDEVTATLSATADTAVRLTIDALSARAGGARQVQSG